MSNSEYLVRGATLVCSNGSHKRRLNLPKCHGVYAGTHPLVHDMECLSETSFGKEHCNITSFGVCNPAEGSPPQTDIKTYKKTINNSKDGTTGTVTGCQCMPIIIGPWRIAYENTRIVDNGDKNPLGRTPGPIAVEQPVFSYNTVTMNSFLLCRYGGIIRPIDSGQHTKVLDNEFCSLIDFRKLQSMLREQGYPWIY